MVKVIVFKSLIAFEVKDEYTILKVQPTISYVKLEPVPHECQYYPEK